MSGVTLVETTATDAPEALVHAAGLCGRMAADLGARVIRIEDPGSKPSSADLFLHTGKERLSTQPRNRAALIADFAKEADALIVDPASFAAMPEQSCSAIAVILAMSRDAPERGSEFTVEARSGLLDLVGDPTREPLRLGGHQIGYSGGLAAYLGMIAALLRRKAGLPGGPVHVDLLDVAVWLNWKTLSTASRTGRAPTRAGAAAEWSVVACSDGYVALVYRVQEWEALKTATNDVRLNDERFQTAAGRRLHRGDLNTILADIFSSKTRSEIRAMALSKKLPLGPVWTPDELRDNPHMIARNFLYLVETGEAPVPMPTLPVKWNKRTFAPAIANSAIPIALDPAE
ncbi:CoA transferase [Microvirga alba]|uniref:CoA transferase n=1 Tax=Microvirga alba TaxID=2791025 RepID=A0A931BPT6_9HYPH|nr:CoA transferase [Microvirga alba]MBF9233848.1 CoA transferase [Microvirga alba]